MKLKEEKKDTEYEKAIFAMGCFWGVQAIFDSVRGVFSTRVGYSGGRTRNPTYKEACSDTSETDDTWSVY